MVTVLEDEGKLDEAEKMINPLLEKNPDDSRGHYHSGNILAKRGRLEEAASELRSALRGRLTPEENRDARRMHKAVVYRLLDDTKKSNDVERAVGYMKSALYTQPDNPDFHSVFGAMMLERGMMDKAETAFREAIKIDPRHPTAHIGLGHTLQRTGRVQDGVVELKAAVAGLKVEFEREINPTAKKSICELLAQVSKESGDLQSAQHFAGLAYTMK